MFFGKSDLTIGGIGGANGDGGAIAISGGAAGLAISTTGAFSHGIWAQSLGGGGGATRAVLDLPALTQTSASAATDRSAATGTGGAIQITIANGNISATGPDSFGILAQSGFQTQTGRLDTSKLGGDISITYTGTIVGGSGNGAAIGVDGGFANLITLGAGSTVSALSGKAILAAIGPTRWSIMAPLSATSTSLLASWPASGTRSSTRRTAPIAAAPPAPSPWGNGRATCP